MLLCPHLLFPRAPARLAPCPLSPFSPLLSYLSCFPAPISSLLFPRSFSSLLFLHSCLLPPVSPLLSPLSCFSTPVPSPVSPLLSPLSCFSPPISSLPFLPSFSSLLYPRCPRSCPRSTCCRSPSPCPAPVPAASLGAQAWQKPPALISAAQERNEPLGNPEGKAEPGCPHRHPAAPGFSF